MTVMIAGGGIAGLTLALSLHRAGVPCHVYESAPEVGALGVGINLLPHATRLLCELGLEDDLARESVTTAESAKFRKTLRAAADLFSSNELAIVRRGAPEGPLEEERHAFMRYRGQGHEVMVPLPAGRYGDGDAARLADAFAAAYGALYSRTIPGVDIEVVSWALSLRAPVELAVETPAPAEPYVPQPAGRRALFDPGRGETIEVEVYRRADLRPGAHIAGPALIVEDETSTVVSPAFDAAIDGYGYIELNRRGD